MALAAGEQSVRAFVEFELIKLAARINVSGNLNDVQVQFIASQLVGMFPNETIADFKLCFERGSIGAYGKIFKLDGVEIGTWMKAYLDEKYQVMENELMKEKDDQYKHVAPEPTDPDAHQKWIDKLKEATKPLDDKKIPPLDDKDIRLEGKEKPKAKFHPFTPVSVIQQQELHLEWVRKNFDLHTREKLPTWKPEPEWIESLTEAEKVEIFKKGKCFIEKIAR